MTKIIIGHGGIDADGNWFESPSQEIDIEGTADEYFQRLWDALPPAKPDLMLCSQWFSDELAKARKAS